ncbi:MAG: hypothetical protein QXS54_06380 [Candidatus Methanomethylicaceae archaeon]
MSLFSRSAEVELSYQLLSDQMLDEKISQVSAIRDVLAPGDDKRAIALGNNFYIVHDPNKESHWYYCETLAITASNWAMARDGSWLWLIKRGGMLSCFDIDEQRLQEFSHVMPYEKILYAEENKAVVLRRDMPAIDVVELRRDHLKRTASVSFETHGLVEDIGFLLERNRFFFLEHHWFESREHYVLCALDWNGQTEVLLDVRNANVKLRLPFAVVLDKSSNTLMYMDLREETARPEQTKWRLNPKWAESTWRLNDVFVFNNELFVKLSATAREVLIHLGQHPEVVFKKQVGSLFLNQLGRFLVGSIDRYDEYGNELREQLVYDLTAQRRTSNISCSALLRQVFQDERERRKSLAHVKLQLPVPGEKETSNLDTFRISLRPMPSHTTQVVFDTFRIFDSSSSTRGDLALFAGNKVWLLRRDMDHAQYILPNTNNEPTYHLAGKWSSITFDEQDRLWVCDAGTRYVAFIPRDGQEGLGFALRSQEPSVSDINSISAYADHIALISRSMYRNHFLTIYHFNKQSLRTVFSWESQRELVRVKPDTNRGGWWLLAFDSWARASMLYYLEIQEGSPKVMATVYQKVEVLGNWPDQTYFVYLDKERMLHYTSDPNHGWQQVSLEHILGKSRSQDKPIYPISLQVVCGKIFLMLANYSSNDYLLMRLQANDAQLITALRCSSVVRIARWKDWLIVYEPNGSDFLAVSPTYSTQATIDDVPKNRRFLFYHPDTDGFYTAAYNPYSATMALRRSLLNKNGQRLF